MLQKLTFNNLYFELTARGTPLMPTGVDILDKLGYYDNYLDLDTLYLLATYSNFTLADEIVWGDKINLDVVKTLIKAVFNSNKYKYDKLYQTITYEYDYDKNYNRHKEYNDTYTNGERVTNRSLGARQTSNKTDPTKSTVTQKDNGLANEDLTTSNQVTSETETITSTTDSAAYTDTDTQSESVDTHVVVEDEYGDLSVRTVADTLERERKIAHFSIYDEIYRDIVYMLGGSNIDS